MDNSDFDIENSPTFSLSSSRWRYLDMIPPELCYGCPRVLFGLIAFLFQESLQLHTGPLASLPLVERLEK